VKQGVCGAAAIAFSRERFLTRLDRLPRVLSVLVYKKRVSCEM